MLLVPLVSGAAVALHSSDQVLPVVLFTCAALLLFWLRTPVESWLGTTPMRAQTEGERRRVLLVIAVLGIVAGVLLALLFWNGDNRDLLLIGAAAGAAVAIQAVIKKFGRAMRMPAQIIGAAGLSSCAAAAYYVAAGRLDSRALALWLANWLFAANQIHFVQLRIHAAKTSGLAAKARRGSTFMSFQLLIIAAILLAAKLSFFPWMVALAFAPALTRGFAWLLQRPKPLVVRRLGQSELAHAIVFGLLLILSFRQA